MIINVTINLVDEDDSLAYTADAAASQVLSALGANPTNDVCYVSISQQTQGEAGNPPAPVGAQ